MGTGEGTGRSPLVDTAELATWLGTTREAVHVRRSRGQLPPAIRIGRRIFWRRAVLERWLREQERLDKAAGGAA